MKKNRVQKLKIVKCEKLIDRHLNIDFLTCVPCGNYGRMYTVTEEDLVIFVHIFNMLE